MIKDFKGLKTTVLSVASILPATGSSILEVSFTAGISNTVITAEEVSEEGVFLITSKPAGSTPENTIELLSGENWIENGLLFAEEHENEQIAPKLIKAAQTKHLYIL